MPVFNNILAGAAGSGGAADYKIERSLRFEPSDSAYLNFNASAGSYTTWTLSTWIKKTGKDNHIFGAGAGNNPGRFALTFDNDDKISVFVVDNNNTVYLQNSAAVFRDPSAWYHIIVVADTTNTTPADRLKIYVNGVRQTLDGGSMPANQNTFVNTASAHAIGRRSYTASDYFDGYIADFQFLDGIAVSDETDFGEFDDNGVWQAIKYTGSYNFTPTVTYPAVYVTSPGAYGVVTDVNTVNGSVFSSAGSSGAGSIKVEFASAITGVTDIRFKGGGYSAAATFSIKVNGVTTHTNLSTNSSYTVRDESLTSATDITSFEIVSASDGWALGDLQFSTDSGNTFTAPSGTAAVIPNAGVNGFHLDFSDNSSNAALGFDALVSGTRYSADWSGSLANNYTFATLFDGDVSTLCLGANGATLTWTPSTTITWTDAAGGVEIDYHNTSSPDKARVNGGSWVNQANNSGGWEKVTTGDGTLTKLEVRDQSSSEAAIYAIRVNGTILTNPSGANDWTVNNLTAYKAATGNHGVTRGTSTLNYDPSVILDGDINTHYADRPINGNGVNFTGIPAANTQLRVRFHYIQSGTMTTNGGHVIASGSQNGAWSEPSGISYPFTLTSISVTGGNAGDGFGIAAIEVDGTILTLGSGANTDSLFDSPTNYEADSGNNGGNHCTLNPLTTTGGNSGTSNGTLSQGNLKLTNTASNTWCVETGTIGVSSGKWYYEYVCSGTITNFLGGWADPREVNYNDAVGNTARSYGYYSTGSARNSNSNSSLGSSYAAGDVIGCAIDIDNKKIYWSKNGVWQNSANLAAGTGSVYTIQDPVRWNFVYTPAVSTYDANSSVNCNFGQRPFNYPPGGTGGPPSDYKSLCTQNLDAPEITKPSSVFDVKLYTGNESTQNITTFGFSPDLVLRKGTYKPGVSGTPSGVTESNHWLAFDTVRTAGKRLILSNNSIEDTGSTTLTAFTSNGFTLGNSTDGNDDPQEYTAVCFDAGDASSQTSISVGGLNSSIYNTSDRWSDDVAGATYGGAGMPKSRMFNGNLTQNVIANSGTALTFSPSGFSSISSLRIYGSSYTGNSNGITVNGTDYTSSFTSTAKWVTIPVTSLTSVVWSTTSSGLENGNLYGIEVDGKLLVDDNETPPTVPAAASTQRANPSAGFSIVKVDNPNSTESRAHGLNKKPDFIVAKALTAQQQWHIYHSALGKDYYGTFQTNQFSSSDQWGSKEPDSSLFYVKSNTGSGANYSGGMIYYLWTAVEGFSAFGKYVGTGVNDGPHIMTNFAPKFVLTKASSAGSEWLMWDRAREPYNVKTRSMHMGADSESGYGMEFLSNGFKTSINYGSSSNNANVTYVWAAWADNPFQQNGGIAV